MAEVSFMKIDGIDGESKIKGQDAKIDVLEFEHEVSKAVDPLNCARVTSDRHHGKVKIVKTFDKASPLIYQKLCQGGTISEIKIEWFRQPASGGSDPEHYFTHTFKDCIITAVRPYMRNVRDSQYDKFGHMECVEWGYKQVTWTSETGGTEFVDETVS
jgi:type VI secretion system secreted protein Hcp